MDTDTLVENRIEEGRELAEELSRRGLKVTTAFWLKASEDGKWRFYLVSPLVDAEGLTRTYQRLHPLIWAMPRSMWIDPLEIRLIGSSNPIAQDVLAIQAQPFGPQGSLVRWSGKRLGDTSIDGVYLYPPSVPATR